MVPIRIKQWYRSAHRTKQCIAHVVPVNAMAHSQFKYARTDLAPVGVKNLNLSKKNPTKQKLEPR